MIALRAVARCLLLVAALASETVAAQLVADLAAAAGPGEDVHTRLVDTRLDPPDGDGFTPVRFAPGPAPGIELRAGAGGAGGVGAAWNWAGATALRMHLQNAMPWPVTVQLRVTDSAGGSLEATLGLPPGGPLTLSLPLAATSPRRWGMTAGPPIPWLQDKAPVATALSVTGNVDRARIEAIRIGMPAPAAEQTLRIGKVFLEPKADLERLAYDGIVDAFGQYQRGDWPQKYRPPAGVDPDEGFRRFAQAEEESSSDAARSAASDADTLDRFGGLQGTLRLPATGRFRTAKVRAAEGTERWVLVTPEGNPFFSLGVNAIQMSNSETFVEGREFMFTGLPAAGSPLARFAGRRDSTDALPASAGAQRGRGFARGATFDFYRANLYRRDGADFPARWVERTTGRLQRWGFNTVGAWSDPAVRVAPPARDAVPRLPYTRILHVDGDFDRLSDGRDWWHGIPDPFDPRFAQALDRTVRDGTAGSRDDPWLIGYFIDNELGWGDGAAQDPAVRYALALSALRGDARDGGGHAKQAFIALLRARHGGSIERLSERWARRFGAWAELEAPLAQDRLPDAALPAVAADFSAFLSLHAERYFRQVAEAIARHAPGQLYLGARFASRNPEALAACARWCDVVSFNLYLPHIGVGFEAQAFSRLEKPALLTEFHFGSSDRGPFWHGVMPVASEADRGPAYARMLDSVLANPAFVGAHWFQYLDQPVTGRWLDGENGHLGLVAITDIPWGGFVSQVAAANRSVRDRLREQLGRPR